MTSSVWTLTSPTTTVYITDNYTGDFVKVNVTDTRFTFSTSEDCPCPIYQVSAWNAGGEGELSRTLQRCRPLGKLSFSTKDTETVKLCKLTILILPSSSQDSSWKH